MELEIGERFSDQIEHNDMPHAYEGLVYEGDAIYMFCQTGYHRFDLINLDVGNRLTHEGSKIQGGETGRDRLGLRCINEALEGEILTCKGKLNDWLGSME